MGWGEYEALEHQHHHHLHASSASAEAVAAPRCLTTTLHITFDINFVTHRPSYSEQFQKHLLHNYDPHPNARTDTHPSIYTNALYRYISTYTLIGLCSICIYLDAYVHIYILMNVGMYAGICRYIYIHICLNR